MGEGPDRRLNFRTPCWRPPRRMPARCPATRLSPGPRCTTVFAFPSDRCRAHGRVGRIPRRRARCPNRHCPCTRFADAAMAAFLDAHRADPVLGPAATKDARYEFFQAQGMVMIQLGVNMSVAMARLRAYAYAHDRVLSDVAERRRRRQAGPAAARRAAAPTTGRSGRGFQMTTVRGRPRCGCVRRGGRHVGRRVRPDRVSCRWSQRTPLSWWAPHSRVAGGRPAGSAGTDGRLRTDGWRPGTCG